MSRNAHSLRWSLPPFFCLLFFFSSRRRHTRCSRDWSSDVCSSDLNRATYHGQHHLGLANVAGFNFEKVLGNDDQIGYSARFDGAFRLLPPTRDCRSQSVSLDGIFQADALLRNESSRRIALVGLTRECTLYARPGIERDHGPVAAERQHATGALNAVPRPGTLRSLRADITRPDVERVVVGISVQRLEAGNHPYPSELRNVFLRKRLDVFHTVPGILSVIDLGGTLVGIQCQPHGSVADRVREDLKSAPIQSFHRLLVLCRVPEQRT